MTDSGCGSRALPLSSTIAAVIAGSALTSVTVISSSVSFTSFPRVPDVYAITVMVSSARSSSALALIVLVTEPPASRFPDVGLNVYFSGSLGSSTKLMWSSTVLSGSASSFSVPEPPSLMVLSAFSVESRVNLNFCSSASSIVITFDRWGSPSI